MTLFTHTNPVRQAVATALLVAMVWSPVASAQSRNVAPASAGETPAKAGATSAGVTSEITPRELPFFGPQKYVRTTGAKDVYVANITVPPWLVSPFRLHVDNGEPNGANRVSSATIDVNGTEVLEQSDFNQNAASYDRTVTLTPSSKLTVTLASKPTSFLTINLLGTSADYTPPVLTWSQPIPSSTINNTTPRILLQYSDPKGTDEPAAAGVDPDTLKVWIDDVDRTSLFTRRSDEASAQIPAPGLDIGTHTFKATISDLARNPKEISGEFRVDLVSPTITIVEPATGSYLPTRTPAIRIQYQDETALSLASFRVFLNGNDVSPFFVKTENEAVIGWLPGMQLAEGLNTVLAKIQDRGGNEATASITFNVDVQSPKIAIAQPATGNRFGSRDLAVTIPWSDDQALNLNSATATIDGANVALTTTNTQGTAQLTNLADGPHTLLARIADRAGNLSTDTSAFIVDTTVPTIEVVEPPPGAKLKTNTPDVRITYSDDQGVDTNTLKVEINAIDRTHLFAASNASAAASITGFNLPEGTNEIAAEIRDITANLGRAISSFFVDTIPPTGTIESPVDREITSTPTATVRYSDSGTGIDPTSVHLFVDSADRTPLITATNERASGVLSLLPDGNHEVKFTFADQAGNPTTVAKSFVIDTHAPQLAIAMPANDSFINSTVPALRITYSDPEGTGVDLSTFRLMLRKGTDAEIDIAPYVTAGALEAIGIVPDASALTDGTYHLRAQIADVAGNVSTADASFEVDTVAPAFQVEAPAPNGYVASTTPQFTIRYNDDRSGVDTTRAIVLIDNIDRTEQFTFNANVATGTLLPEQALTEGRHTIDVTVYDRAGNRATVAPVSFTVDTIAPAAEIESPLSGSYVGKVPHNFAVTYSDEGVAGVDPASVRVAIDETDRTSEFTVGPTRATAAIATQLSDGSHTLVVSVLDWAGNSASATSTFTVDAVDPVVTITTPVANAWLKGPTIDVSGSVADASPVSVEVNGILASLATGPFSATIPAADGAFTVQVVAHDAAGNIGTAEISVTIDSAPPVITITTPAAPLFTSADTAQIAGTIADASAVTLTLNGEPLALDSNTFATPVFLPVEGANVFTFVATDAASNSSTEIVTITRDTIAPEVTVASPVESSILGTVPVIIRGTFADATAVAITVDGVTATQTGEAWEATVDGLEEGRHTFVVVATDAAGNTKTTERQVTIDLNAPIVVITSPVNGALTKDATIAITGTATDVSLVSVIASGISATLAEGDTEDEKTFTIEGVPLVDGDNTLQVEAKDALARTTQKSVFVTRDSIVPVITVAGPDQVTRSRSAKLVATATDNLAINDVVFKLGSDELARLTEEPFEYIFSAPASAAIGDTLAVLVTATDAAGNTASVTKSIRLVAEGALTGQVLSDVNSQPVPGAHVRLIASEPKETTTDERGRYGFPVNDQNVVLTMDGLIGGAPTTRVDRVVAIHSGVGTVPVDARLTPLGPGAVVGASGATIVNSNITVSIPSGAVVAPTIGHVTPLSPQALPNLLPLGWSPIAAFDVFVESELAAPLPFSATISGLSGTTAQFVFYDTEMHAWTMSQAGAATGGALSLPKPGSYALVVADDASVPIAANGDVLVGIDMKAIPDTATSSGEVTPPVLPPSGGSATGKLVVTSPTPLPSGTIVQAEVTETFSMATGETASEERRTEDLVLYRDGSNLAASFPIVPSRTFTGSDLLEGRVHLDILAGREAVRGKTGGGDQAASINAGLVNVTVPAGSLPNDVAISATPTILSSFLPFSPAASPFAEVVLDFSGFTLASSAELSASASSLSASDTVVIARVERVQGIPKVIVVAAALREGDRVVSTDLAGFAGIRTGGRYVFYRIGVPWSTITGTIGSTSALIQVDGLPFVALTDAQGHFNAIAPVGMAHVTATVPGTSLTGSATVSVTGGQTATTSFGVAPTLTTATVTPANGAIRVPVSVQVEITATAPLNQFSANSNTVQLRNSTNVFVPASYVFANSGRALAIVPSASLAPGETHTVTINGLTDIYGGAVSVPPVTFTTLAEVPPVYDPESIVFTMPDGNGIVHVSAAPGTLPPGTRVLIVNSGNSVVVSFTVGNDGSFTGELLASIDDRLLITVSDPKGNVTNFEKSKYVATDGSGRVGIGPAGGRVEGTNGTAIVVPDGGLAQGAVFKVEYFGAEEFPERPPFPDAHFGGGLRITSEQMPKLEKEGKLIFPRPADAPEGSFFYVVRRVTGPGGRVDFETVDNALPNAEGKIETASAPWIGWGDSTTSWQLAADTQAIGFGVGAIVNMMLMWTWESSLPGIPLPGALLGMAFEIQFENGQQKFKPIEGAMISALDSTGHLFWENSDSPGIFARSQADGRFALWDWRYTGGTVRVNGHLPDGRAVTVTAFEANPLDSKTFFTQLLQRYRNVANANVTFPPLQIPTSPEAEVHVFRLTNDLKRIDIGGITTTNTSLVIGFKMKNGQGAITSASVNGEELQVKKDDGTLGNAPLMDYILTNPYSATAAGKHSVRATIVNPLDPTAPPVEVESTFLVVAGGGSNGVSLPDEGPDWITKKLVPKNNEFGVPLNVLPQVVFTEPVVNVFQGVSFTKSVGSGEQDAAFLLSGVGLDANGFPVLIPNLNDVPADTPITSITLQPIGGLDFGTVYRLKLSSTIEDRDVDAMGNPAPKPFPDRLLGFSTVKPAPLGDSGDQFESPAVVVLGGYAFVARKEPLGVNGFMTVYDLTHDSFTNPVEVGRAAVSGQPVDISGELASEVNDGYPAVVIGSGLKFKVPGPSNVYMFDVREPTDPKRVAAVSVTESPEDGTVLKTFMRKRFAYTITFPHGIQIIDLDLAKRLHAEASGNAQSRLQMARALVTPGIGFGQSAVVQTIPLKTSTGSLVHVFDLQAGEYQVNGSLRTLIYATGIQPLVIVDQLDPTHPVVQAPPPTANGILESGRGVVLARISNHDLAIVIGNGTARQDGFGALVSGGYGLMVFDLSNPLVPNLIGSFALRDAPTDLAVNGSTVLVATGAGTLGFSLVDPTKPRFLGTIAGTASRIAIEPNGGILVSVGPRGAVAASGLHTASLFPVLLVQRVDAIKIEATGSGTVNSPAPVRSLEQTTVKVRLIPPASADNGSVSITNAKFPRPDGSDGGVSTDSFIINWTDPENGEGEIHLGANNFYEDTELVAVASAVTSVGPLVSQPRKIKLGWVKATVDSNNNTQIDDRDDEAKRKGRAFAFWESDPRYELFQIEKDRSGVVGALAGSFSDEFNRDDALKGLADWATLKLTVNKWWKDEQGNGAVRLRLHFNGQPAAWYISEKVGLGLDYLSSRDTAADQKAKILGELNPEQIIPICKVEGDKFVKPPSECGDAFGWIVLPTLTNGTYELLFRCASCNRESVHDPDATAELLVEWGPSESGPWTPFDRAKVDIRPVNQWMTIMSAREPSGLIFKPLATMIEPNPIPDTASPFANSAWPGITQIPPKAKNVSVVVHGYNVPPEDAQQKFFPTYIKRLYWVGHPVLRRQGQWWKEDDSPGCVHDCAHTVGISWPSNDFGESTAEQIITELPGLRDTYSSMRFIYDEYHAFGTGPALAKYLTALRGELGGRSINVLAHSLGNLAVNSALYRLNTSGIVDKYVMNEAAFAAEALDLAYGPTADELTLYGDQHAATYGYPDDTTWEQDWSFNSTLGDTSRWERRVNEMRSQGADGGISYEEMYTRRWTQIRPFPVPDNDQSGHSRRGPWNAYFGRNRTFTRIFNTYSENDRVVGVAFRANQRILKPFSYVGYLADSKIRGALNKAINALVTKRILNITPEEGQAAMKTKSFIEKLIPDVPELQTHDSMAQLNWALLKWTRPEQATVFGAADTQHWSTLRQWAELSFWFPATSVGAGVKNLDTVLGSHCNVDQCNFDFTKYSGLGDGPVPPESFGPIKDSAIYGFVFGFTHSYLGYGKLTDVWKAYVEIAKILDPKN